MKKQILGSLLVLLSGMAMLLSGCGQKGELYLPTDPEAQDRAQFPKVLLPPTP
jgi:predicted small lipoprotein YifL